MSLSVVEIKFTITFKNAKGIEGNHCQLEWERKGSEGKALGKKVKNGFAEFEDSVSFQCKMFGTPEKLEPYLMFLYLIELDAKGKKIKELGMIELNLSDYVALDFSSPSRVTLVDLIMKSKGVGPILKIEISYQIIKFKKNGEYFIANSKGEWEVSVQEDDFCEEIDEYLKQVPTKKKRPLSLPKSLSVVKLKEELIIMSHETQKNQRRKEKSKKIRQAK